MPPRCHVNRCISQEARGGGTTRNPFPTRISVVDGSRSVFSGPSNNRRRLPLQGRRVNIKWATIAYSFIPFIIVRLMFMPTGYRILELRQKAAKAAAKAAPEFDLSAAYRR